MAFELSRYNFIPRMHESVQGNKDDLNIKTLENMTLVPTLDFEH